MGDQADGKLRSLIPHFRSDIEGLRGIAIAIVVLFHAGIAVFGGGFVGVDVFFVLSGFLITGLLLREREETGQISLSRFYARRSRRLLPAAALVLVVTLAASYFLLPDLLVRGIAIDTAAAALYVSNITFAFHATDYFAATTAPSPILHFWSLAVEEQFYLFWPAIVLLVTRRARAPRINVRATLLVVGASSFAIALWLLKFNAPWAFFSLPSRAWELALGGLLAVSAASLKKLPKYAAIASTWLGIAGIIFSAVYLKESAPFPGVPALLPTISAALVIAGGTSEIKSHPVRLLETRPLRYLGRISYSLYLWHWPLFVIPLTLSIKPLTLAQRTYLAIAAVSLAAVTQRFVESPLRKGWAIGTKPRRNLVAAMALALAVAAAAFAVNIDLNANALKTTSTASAEQKSERLDAILSSAAVPPAPLQTEQLGAPSAVKDSRSIQASASASTAIATIPIKTASPKAKPKVKPKAKSVKPTQNLSVASAAPSVTPNVSATSSASAQPVEASPTPSLSDSTLPTEVPTPEAITVAVRPATLDFPVPADIDPSLATAKNDRALPFYDGCHTQQNMKPSTKPCLYGNLKGKQTVVLFGDSHALSWFPAVNKVAKSHGWKLLSLTMSACTPADIPAWSPTLNSVMKNCALWRKAALAKIAAASPYIVIISGTRGFATSDNDGNVLTGAARITAFHDGLSRTIEEVKTSAEHVVLLEDTPASNFDPPICLATHRLSTLACSTPVDKAIQNSWQSLELAIATEKSIPVIDPSFWVCPTSPCPAVIGNLLVYSDPGHLTANFAAALAHRFGDAITSAIRS